MDVFMNCEVPTVSLSARSRKHARSVGEARSVTGGRTFLRAGPHAEDGRGRAGGTPSFPCCKGCSVALVQVLDLLDSDDEDQVSCGFGTVMFHDAMVHFASPGGAADRVGSLG